MAGPRWARPALGGRPDLQLHPSSTLYFPCFSRSLSCFTWYFFQNKWTRKKSRVWCTLDGLIWSPFQDKTSIEVVWTKWENPESVVWRLFRGPEDLAVMLCQCEHCSAFGPGTSSGSGCGFMACVGLDFSNFNQSRIACVFYNSNTLLLSLVGF